jgi:hypothetical protein
MDGDQPLFCDIRVVLRNGTIQLGRETTDHASWRCVCRLQLRALTVTTRPPYTETTCPSCQRRYKFEPADNAVVETEGTE